MMPPAGWICIGPDPAIARWATAARLAARSAPADGRAGGTWDLGLDALPNDADGAVAGEPFPWAALPLTPAALHRAQVSTIRPGYPRTDGDEAAHRWRRDRDGAHLDGVPADGPVRRRHVAEPHAWILGLPLTDCDAGASPLVVWEESHVILRAALLAALSPHPPEHWGQVDVTDAYQTARARVFAECRRTELPARPGMALLVHRLMLHGVAPWAAGAQAAPDGRRVAYLRPVLPTVRDWLAAD